MKIYYKIVESDGDVIKTLFHGINKTRTLTRNQWIKAEIKDNVMDGKGKKYTSGIHIIDGLDEAKSYMTKFRKQNRIIVECHAKGLKIKMHSKHYVYLADEVFIL